MEEKVELKLPSVLGSEKAAIEQAATIAQKMGFSEDRVEDLKTAVSEACINAIEHGNKFNENTRVGVSLTIGEKQLQVAVHDEGSGFNAVDIPAEITEDCEIPPRRRGWGMFLIKNLVNELSYEAIPGQGNEVRMIIHLEK